MNFFFVPLAMPGLVGRGWGDREGETESQTEKNGKERNHVPRLMAYIFIYNFSFRLSR